MGPGTQLRNARQERGMSLREISAKTKISMRALEAIERNEIGRLPGGIFTRAFLRAYAVQVGLDPEKVVRDYVAETEPAPQLEDDLEKLRARCAARNGRRGSGWRLTVVLGSGLVLTAVLSLSSGLERRRAASEPPGVSGALVAVRALPAEPEREPAPGLPVVGEDSRGIRLEIESRDACWIHAETDDERLVERLMEPGERALIEAQCYIVLRVGDAGALLYWINGVPGRSLGRPGDLVTVKITEDNFRSFLGDAVS